MSINISDKSFANKAFIIIIIIVYVVIGRDMNVSLILLPSSPSSSTPLQLAHSTLLASSICFPHTHHVSLASSRAFHIKESCICREPFEVVKSVIFINKLILPNFRFKGMPQRYIHKWR